MVAAVAGVLPLTLTRLGVVFSLPYENIAFSADLMVGYASLAGVAGSLVLGLPYLVGSGRLTDQPWSRRVSPVYSAAAAVCENYRMRMARSTLASDQMTAVRLVLIDLPSQLQAVKANPGPRSSAARKAKRDLERALRKYLSSARSSEELFDEMQKRIGDTTQWERVSRAARDSFVSGMSSDIASAQRDMAKAGAFFEPSSQ